MPVPLRCVLAALTRAVNKQLADKERVLAALENATLLGKVDECLLGID